MPDAQPGPGNGRLGVPASVDPERDARDVYNALVGNVRGLRTELFADVLHAYVVTNEQFDPQKAFDIIRRTGNFDCHNPRIFAQYMAAALVSDRFQGFHSSYKNRLIFEICLLGGKDVANLKNLLQGEAKTKPFSELSLYAVTQRKLHLFKDETATALVELKEAWNAPEKERGTFFLCTSKAFSETEQVGAWIKLVNAAGEDSIAREDMRARVFLRGLNIRPTVRTHSLGYLIALGRYHDIEADSPKAVVTYREKDPQRESRLNGLAESRLAGTSHNWFRRMVRHIPDRQHISRCASAVCSKYSDKLVSAPLDILLKPWDIKAATKKLDAPNIDKTQVAVLALALLDASRTVSEIGLKDNTTAPSKKRAAAILETTVRVLREWGKIETVDSRDMHLPEPSTGDRLFVRQQFIEDQIRRCELSYYALTGEVLSIHENKDGTASETPNVSTQPELIQQAFHIEQAGRKLNAVVDTEAKMVAYYVPRISDKLVALQVIVDFADRHKANMTDEAGLHIMQAILADPVSLISSDGYTPDPDKIQRVKTQLQRLSHQALAKIPDVLAQFRRDFPTETPNNSAWIELLGEVFANGKS